MGIGQLLKTVRSPKISISKILTGRGEEGYVEANGSVGRKRMGLLRDREKDRL